MSVELRMLTLSVVLGILQTIAASHAVSLQRGYRWTASPRDAQVEPLRGVAGRLDGALRNFEFGPDHPHGSTELLPQTDGAVGDRWYALGSRTTEEERLMMKRLR